MTRPRTARACAAAWLCATLALACALFACQGSSTSPAAIAAPDASVTHRFGGAAPSGNGYEYGSGGLLQPTALGPSTQTGATNTFLAGNCDAGGVTNACWSVITADQIGAAFSVSLALASGGGTLEVGAGCTPTYAATPQASSATVVHPSTWADNQSNSTTTSASNNLTAPNGGGAYTLSSPGTVTATITETQLTPSVTRSGSATGCIYDYRYFYGVDSHSGGTAITASSTNATLSGGSASATLTGALFGSGGVNFVGLVFPSVSPSGQYVYLAVPHTASAHTFKDQNGFTFDVGGAPVVSGYSYTNVNSVTAISMDIYRSANPLSASYTITIVSQNDAPPRRAWWLDGPANDDGLQKEAA